MGAGSRYTVRLFDEQDLPVGQVSAALPAPAFVMRSQAAKPELMRHFALWRLPDGGHLTLAWLLGGASAAGDALQFDAPWLPPSTPGHRAVSADLAWHRAGFPPSFGQEIHRERLLLSSGAGQGTWRVDVPARPGFRSTWLTLRLTSTDFHGNRFIHALAPSNPR